MRHPVVLNSTTMEVDDGDGICLIAGGSMVMKKGGRNQVLHFIHLKIKVI